MTDLIQTGVAWLDVQRKAYLSRLVTYQRGLDSVSVGATLGTFEEEGFDESGSIIRTRRIDFIMTAADLILDGAVVKPIPGDRIVDGTDTYEVMAVISGEHYRVADSSGLMVRIHTRLIDE